GGRPERAPAGRSSPRLEVAARGDLDPRAPERHVERTREGLREVQLSRSLGPEAVVDPVGEETEGELAAEETENMEEGHGVGPSAHRDEDGRAPGDEGVVAHGAAHEGDERGR